MLNWLKLQPLELSKNVTPSSGVTSHYVNTTKSVLSFTKQWRVRCGTMWYYTKGPQLRTLDIIKTWYRGETLSIHTRSPHAFSCPSSATQASPPNCFTTSCTRSPSRSCWCPAAAAFPPSWPRRLACGTSSWWVHRSWEIRWNWTVGTEGGGG